MNKNRRKRIADLRERIDIIKNELEEVMEEEQDARENLEAVLLDMQSAAKQVAEDHTVQILMAKLQDSEKAEKMDDTIGSIEYAIGNLEETIENLDEAVSI